MTPMTNLPALIEKVKALTGADRETALVLALAGIFEHFEPHGPRQAPGHCHDIPGRWDEDGSACSWCAHWGTSRTLVATLQARIGGEG